MTLRTPSHATDAFRSCFLCLNHKQNTNLYNLLSHCLFDYEKFKLSFRIVSKKEVDLDRHSFLFLLKLLTSLYCYRFKIGIVMNYTIMKKFFFFLIILRNSKLFDFSVRFNRPGYGWVRLGSFAYRALTIAISLICWTVGPSHYHGRPQVNDGALEPTVLFVVDLTPSTNCMFATATERSFEQREM